MRKNSGITAGELSVLLGINLRNTKKNMDKFKDKGLITRIGSRESGCREVSE